MKKNLSKGSNSKPKEGRAIFFLYVTYRLHLIHIAIKFHQDIPFGDLVMACTKLSKGSNSKTKKGRAIFFVHGIVLTSYTLL